MAKNLIIVVLQPEDDTVSNSARYLAQKPSAQFSNKTLCTLPTVPQSIKADKVYLVGHGGEYLLAGMAPDFLAQEVLLRPSLCAAEKIVLAMCGTRNLAAAEAFATTMHAGVLGRPGYQGNIFAYEFPLLITPPLDGQAEEHIGRKWAEVKGPEGSGKAAIYKARLFKRNISVRID